jgi:hypothetical protein
MPEFNLQEAIDGVWNSIKTSFKTESLWRSYVGGIGSAGAIEGLSEGHFLLAIIVLAGTFYCLVTAKTHYEDELKGVDKSHPTSL